MGVLGICDINEYKKKKGLDECNFKKDSIDKREEPITSIENGIYFEIYKNKNKMAENQSETKLFEFLEKNITLNEAIKGRRNKRKRIIEEEFAGEEEAPKEEKPEVEKKKRELEFTNSLNLIDNAPKEQQADVIKRLIEVNKNENNENYQSENINENNINYDRNARYADYPRKMFELINQIRVDPVGYAHIIEDSMKYIIEVPFIERLIFKRKVKVALNKSEPIFREAIDYLKTLKPLPPLEFNYEICIPLPDNKEELKDKSFLKTQVKHIREKTKIDAFFRKSVHY